MRSYNPNRTRERLAEKQFDWMLPMLLLQNGVLCDLIKVKESKERSVYGHFAGQKIEDSPVNTLLVAGLPISEFRATGGGMYGQGYFKDSDACYADYPELEEGDVIRPHETDVQFIVTNVQGAGVDGRIRRFSLSSIQSGMCPDGHSYPEKLTIL